MDDDDVGMNDIFASYWLAEMEEGDEEDQG